MPAARSARKATKKAPCATGHHSPDVEVDEGPSPVVDGMKATGRQGKAGQAPKVGRTRAQVTATPTRSLPSRRGRNVHPAGQPRIRRSKAQIEADLAAGEKALKEKAREVQAAKEHLAQLNIMEECEEDDLPVSHPQFLSTVIHKRRHADVETDGDESFDLSEADNGSHSDASDNSSSKSNKATETRTKSRRAKRVKGATRQELLARTEELRSAKHNVKKSQQQQKSKDDIGSFTAQELRCKKYANSGLRPQAVAPPNVAQLQQLEADPFELGGICDSDLEDTRLAIAEVDGPTTNPSRRNELVKFREKSEGVHPDKPQAARKLPKSKAAKAIIKAIPYGAREPVTEAHPNVAHQCLNDPRWTRLFLPTLSHTLYISDHPFTDWTWDAGTLIKTVQVVFELAFTNISYELSLQDSIVKAAYNRMKNRRSKIASDVLTLVKTFFERVEFKNQPEKVKEYVHWALRAGGPAYYDVPVPKSCMLRKDDPDYPRPDGFLRSQFILPIAETYMGFSAKSVLSPSLGPRNPPKGLYAIILTAVERAMRAHLTGTFRAPSDFNHRTTWNSMKDFYRILDQISESRWMQALNFTDCDDIENPMDESLLSAYRIDIYIPSSPTKPGA
ncbi:hypothetical protein EDB84DRAFT_1635082 [Lactarius hengduanensis]|nr:hypothetical protein EDB84DRAFT_1635082 [Lactarius hengduanensis]